MTGKIFLSQEVFTNRNNKIYIEYIMEKQQKLEKPLHEYDSFVSPNTGKNVNIKEVVERVDFVRGSVYSHNPCFGALLDNLNFIYAFDIPTQATDGTRLFINPEWTSELTDGEIRLVMVHELLHCVFNHMKRMIGCRKQLGNIAADFEVNGAAMIDRFATQGQFDRIGGMYSDKYINGSDDLWAYEMIYEDLLKSGFIPDAPMLDIIWPKQENKGDAKRMQTSHAWKAGHSEAVHEVNKIVNSEYAKISKQPMQKYTPDEIRRAMTNSIAAASGLIGKYPSKAKSYANKPLEHGVKDEYQTFEQGWDYGVQQSINRMQNIVDMIDMQPLLKNGQQQQKPQGPQPEQEVPATDPAEEALNLPQPPQYGTGNGQIQPLDKDDILTQQEGANIARKNGYKDDFTKEEQLDDIENKWNESISNVAGKEGSTLLTRHILDRKASDYNWQYELRKLMNRSMKNSLKHRNEWGEKRGLARDTMTIKHKQDNKGMKDIVFLVDCSGSVSDDMLSDILSECYSISQKCNIKDITYAYFTTKVELVETNCKRLAGRLSDMAVMLLKDTPRGGHISGGTDFKNALDWVNDIGGARCVIMVTDGYDTVVPKPSKVKNLIWTVYDNPSFKSADNSHVVYLDTTKMNK